MRTSDYCTYTSRRRIGYASLIEVFFVFFLFTRSQQNIRILNPSILTTLLLPRLGASSSSRVVWVSPWRLGSPGHCFAGDTSLAHMVRGSRLSAVWLT